MNNLKTGSEHNKTTKLENCVHEHNRTGITDFMMNPKTKKTTTQSKKYLITLSVLMVATILITNLATSHKSTDNVKAHKISTLTVQEQLSKEQHERIVRIDTLTETIQAQHEHEIKKGDTYWKIANAYKPENVDVKDYMNLIQKMNAKNTFQVGFVLSLPSVQDLSDADIIMPTIDVKFDLDDPVLIQHIKHAEGTMEGQSKIKRRLLTGVGSPVQNGKFYPYQDSRGNWTIGYGHFISTSSEKSKAQQYAGGLTESQADALLRKDMRRVYDDFYRILQRKRATDLPGDVQMALFELTFNMGIGNISKFNGMWSSLQDGDYQNASYHLGNSAWSKQVQRERVSRITTMIANNESV